MRPDYEILFISGSITNINKTIVSTKRPPNQTILVLGGLE